MNSLTEKLIIALVVLPAVFGIFKGAKEMTVIAGAIAVALFFANLDKFSYFKGGGVEARLKEAVDEAYAALEELKDLGLALSSPIVDELALSGRMMQYMPLKYKLERVEEISQTLKKLGAKIKIQDGYIIAEAKKGLKGTKINFPKIKRVKNCI